MTRSAALLIAALLLATAAAATPPPPDTPEGLLSFARARLAEGDSFRAATEYLRFLHHFPDHRDTADAWEGLGRAYGEAGRWEDAVGAFSHLGEVRPDAETRRLLGAALYRAERYRDAARILLDAHSETGAPAEPTLGTLALLRAGDTTALPAAPRPDLIDAYRALPRKSAGVAGTLSAVLPGAGHLYTGRPRDAVVALVLNGAFLWGTYESARREQWAVAGILGAFELGWYTGTVVSAMNAAHKWNRREEGRFFRRWEEGSLPDWRVSLGPGSLGTSLTWRW